MTTRKKKANKLKPRLIKGFRDIFSEELLARRWLIEKAEKIYEKYGFVPIDTPGMEYLDILGKYLPESDQADEGVFAFRDDDKKWLAMRYDLTAPLSRVIAQYQELPRPFRRYQLGVVWRDEKPGLGRFREFYQFDIDIVGSSSMAADAELCMIICEFMQNLGLKPDEYRLRINNRKILNGILEQIGIVPLDDRGDFTHQALTTLRAIDKMDRLGIKGVIELLSKGRTDESGDFTEGAGLAVEQIKVIEQYLAISAQSREQVCIQLTELVQSSAMGREGIEELREIDRFLAAAGHVGESIVIDPTVVRGLGYYTGPVFETEITIPYYDKKGKQRSFGSVFSGGRYDNLVTRFLGQKVPATGASIGLDRLVEAMRCYGKIKTPKATAQVLVTTMDKKLMLEYQSITSQLRQANICAEMYLAKGNLKKQLKYADHWDIPIAIILGEDEMAKQQVTIKDLRKGRQVAESIKDREEWLKAEEMQKTIPRDQMVATIRELFSNDQFTNRI